MFSTGLLTGHRILVTGGGTGLGHAMASRFSSLGATVIIAGRRLGVLQEAAATMPGPVEVHVLDIRDAGMVEAVIGDIFATRPLTGLVNNAAGNFISRTEDVSPRGFDAVANIVAHGTFYVTNAVGTRWIAAGQGGSVLSILTTMVTTGGPFMVPSAMAKAAVHTMTKSLAAEWGRYGIRLNGIAPGEIPTEGMNARLMPGEVPGQRTAARNPMGRCGTLDEIATLATFLMADGCTWINGEIIALDGGQALATGASFYDLRAWGDDQWNAARDAIRSSNAKDRSRV